MIIGLTGNIGSGKSTVAAHLQKLGAEVVDTDKIARLLVEPGKPALKEIAANFGPGVLNNDGTLNRGAVADLVFQDPAARQKLNQIMHPRIINEVKDIISRYRGNRGSKAPALVIEAPLLFETGMDELVDEVWVVTAEAGVQLERVVKRGGVDEEEARRRLASQMPQEEKVQRAHRVIDNSGTLDETIQQVDEFWETVIQDSGHNKQ